MRLPIQIQAILYRKINTKIQYLLLKRISDTGGFWQPITGGIEKGETKTQALKREIQEETGINNLAKIIKNVHYYEYWDYYKPEACIRLIKEHVFVVEIHPKRENHNQLGTHRTQMVQFQRSTKKTKQNSQHTEVNRSNLQFARL